MPRSTPDYITIDTGEAPAMSLLDSEEAKSVCPHQISSPSMLAKLLVVSMVGT